MPASDPCLPSEPVFQRHVPALRTARTLILNALLALIMAPLPVLAASVWVPAWTASASLPDRNSGPQGGPLVYQNQSVRQDMRLGTSGRALRFVFSNELGHDALKIGSARVQLTGSDRPAVPVQFNSNSEIVIPPGGVVLSDPVALAVPALGSVSLTLWFPEKVQPAVRRTALRVADGQTAIDERTKLAYRQNVVSAILTERDSKPLEVVALGDSITEGATATHGSQGDWPALLSARLQQACPDRVVILNAGISGNRVLDAGKSPSALSRLQRDVIALPGVDRVILLAGINDIRQGQVTAGRSAEQVIAGYRQILSRLQQQHIQVIGATLTPFAGSARYEPVAAATRLKLNDFIRHSGEFSAVIDFDRILRDPQHPESLPAEITRDHLHPNDEGYRRMAAAVDLSLFSCPARQ